MHRGEKMSIAKASPSTGTGQAYARTRLITVGDAQQEVRSVFLGGSVGQLIAGVIWVVSAALGTFANERLGILALVFGGMLIYPLTRLTLNLMGKTAALGRDNPLGLLPLQSVIAMVAMYPLIYVAALHNPNWFYPAFMIVIGAHYLWFIPLYGMWQYGVLAAVFIGCGLAVGVLMPFVFPLAGWLGGFVLLLFSIIVWRTEGRKT